MANNLNHLSLKYSDLLLGLVQPTRLLIKQQLTSTFRGGELLAQAVT